MFQPRLKYISNGLVKAYLLGFLLTTIIMSCRTGKSAAHNKNDQLFELGDVVLWNEDTLNSYLLVLKKDDSFYYKIITDNKDAAIKDDYRGTYRWLSDSILLNYDNHPCNLNLKGYLVHDASRAYFIQNFSDDRKRVFLRIQRSLFR